MNLLSSWARLPRYSRWLTAIGALTAVVALRQILYSLIGPEGDGVVFLLGNTLVTPTNVLRRVGMRLVNDCVFRASVNTSYDPEYRKMGVVQGDTVKARLPQRYVVGKGATMNPTPVQDRTVDITITDQTHIGVQFGTWALTLEVQDYMERYIAPAVDQIVNEIDDTGLDRMYKKVAKVVGTPGVVPGSTGTLPQAANQTYTDAVTKLKEAAVPNPYCAVLTPNMHGYLVNANSTLFHPVANIAVNFRNGQFAAKQLGIDKWTMDQNVVTHTVGALGGTPLVNGASQTGASITADGASNSITGYFKEGDVIQFASTNEINPLNRRSTTRLKDFVVTADVDSDGSGNLTIPISPSIITSGNFQTATGSPANNDAITTFGHASSYASTETPQAMVYHKDAFTCVMADLELPGGQWVAERLSNGTLGISIRFVKGYNVITDQSPARIDTAHGWAAIREELACRVAS